MGQFQMLSRSLTLIILAAALLVLAASALAARRRPVPGRVRMVPWHGIMFVSLTVALFMLAHLPRAPE